MAAALLRCAAACTVAAFVSLPGIAEAQEQARDFDIPAQDLADALQQFARQAGIQILFPYNAASGKRASAIRGRMPPRRALARLLAGQDLVVTRYDAQRATLRAIKPARRPHRRPPAPEAQPPPPPPPQEIVVTGRAVSAPLESSEYSYAISAIGREDLDREAPPSTAALFRQVPGFWVESSGGEAGNNVRSRGIPTDGFSSIALAENGIPVQYDGALGYLNTDQSFRIDDTIERVEAVRGGPAGLFMPNAPGGVVNFITRSGLREEGGRIRITGGDHAYARVDGYYAARLSDEWGLVAGGFQRRDGGRRQPSYTADEGGQFRLALDYESGGGSASLDLRHLDDRVTFYLPVPLQLGTGGKPEPLPGFDPLRDSLSGPETRLVSMRTGGAPVQFDLTEGTHTRLTALTGRFSLDLGKRATWNGGLRWRHSDTMRNALFPTGTPMEADDYLDSIRTRMLEAYPQTSRLALRHASDGTPYPASGDGLGLVTGANLLSVSVPLDEFIVDSRLGLRIDGAGRHDFALGVTMAHYSYRFDRDMSTVLLEVADEARLVDAVGLDPDGKVTGSYTEHGFQRYGSIFDRVTMRADALALYAADEWRLAPGLRLDYGARWERSAIAGSALGKTTLDLGDPATLADDQVLASAGLSIPVKRDYDGFGWSIGANYQWAQHLGIFARYTRTFHLPSASEFNTAPSRTDEATVPIVMAELGVKYGGENFTLSATAFHTRFERLPFTDFRFDTQSNGYIERTEIADTRTLGMELETAWNPDGPFSIAVQATWQSAKYRNFTFTQLVNGEPVLRDYSGNQLIRVPRLSTRAVPALTLGDGRLRAELTVEHFSRRYSDIANAQTLPPYTLIGLNAQARLAPRLILAAHLTNLTNALALTEGNPRTGSFDTGSGIQRYFFARPEFARTIRTGLTLTF